MAREENTEANLFAQKTSAIDRTLVTASAADHFHADGRLVEKMILRPC